MPTESRNPAIVPWTVAAVALLLLAWVLLRPDPAVEPPKEVAAAPVEASPQPTATPRRAVVPAARPAAQPERKTEPEPRPAVNADAPAAALPQLLSDPSEAPQVEPGDLPLPALETRLDRALGELSADEQLTDLEWSCARGGLDCWLLGSTPSNRALMALEKQLAAEGPLDNGQSVSLRIDRVFATPDGARRFQVQLSVR